ncbi:MAG TPA: hypothetical protein VEQ40_08100 [Pyrinomonadaceae bacterium]|nr:hypothetical protein [Pyrinomonadaceae bacterium]
MIPLALLGVPPVAADGASKIEFLDETGKVAYSFPDGNRAGKQ